MMSNEKINIQEIVDLVSAKLTISKKQVEEFFKVFLPIIEDTLIAGEPLKIKNFGTLKLQWNNPRKSVNVNTGDEIVLEGYNKVVFTPDESLKELVNEPFAHLFPVALNESQTDPIPESGPLRIINEQALEIKNILSEINQLNHKHQEKSDLESKDLVPKEQELVEVDAQESITSMLNEETKTENEESDHTLNSDNLDLLPIVDIADPIAEPQDLTTATKLPENKKPETNVNDKVDAPVEKESNEQTNKITALIAGKQENIQTQKSGKLVWWLSGAVLIAGTIIIMYFFNLNFYRFVNDTISSFVPSKNVLPEATVLSPDTLIISDIDSTKIKEDLFFENLLKKNREYAEVITLERSKKGTSLRQLSEKYYRNEAFWIYIYEANMNEISDSSDIKRGTMLKIPVIDSLLTDTSNVRCFAIAQSLKDELFAKQTEKAEENQIDQQQKKSNIEKEPVISKPELLAIETMEVGSRLTLFARKYYGSKDFWVYIYEANMDVIKNPDNVTVGTKIKIPKLDSKLIDLSNHDCINKAKELQNKYLGR